MPFMIEDLNICCLWYLKSTVSTLYLILEKCRFFIPEFQVTDFEFLQAKGLCVFVFFFFLNRLLINFAWSTKLFPPSFLQIKVAYHLSIAKCLTLQAYMQILVHLVLTHTPPINTSYIYVPLALPTQLSLGPLLSCLKHLNAKATLWTFCIESP